MHEIIIKSQIMILKKTLIISLLVLTISGCNQNDKLHDIENLKKENDSLKVILNNLNQKFIFDSISFREIPSYKNTYDKNSIVSGEFVIIAYNSNSSTNVILADKLNFGNGIDLQNPDTLIQKNGGYYYERQLKDTLQIKGLINVGSEFGKKHQATINSLKVSNY